MDPSRNPFSPGAGSRPPELAGREDIIRDAQTAILRTLAGRQDRSQILLGLRGVGKTVLLNEIERLASENNFLTAFIEAPEDRSLPELLYPHLQQILHKLSVMESAKSAAYRAMRALRSFAGTFKIEYGDFSLSVDPEPGASDSGNLEFDLQELIVRIGEACKAAGRGAVLLIDEVQYLKTADFSALIVALHRTSQKNLPVLFFGAGLPQVAALAGNAKSYAERLFVYPAIGALDRDAAFNAIRQPIESEQEHITGEALDIIFGQTRGYPYFLQEWGYQCWNIAPASPITGAHAMQATDAAIRRLDAGFFRVRFDRLTPKEREYVIAMAQLGPGPYRSSDIAAGLDEQVQSLGPRRASIIQKGMIYSPAHGDIAFTVPMFDEFLRRTHPA